MKNKGWKVTAMENENMTEEFLENNEISEETGEEVVEDTEPSNELSEDINYLEDETIGEEPEKEKVTLSKDTIWSSVKNVLSWVWTIVLAFVIAIIINSYIIRASEVYGSSMYPTLKQGDVVFISRLPYIFGEPKHNDIVVFDSTKEHRNFFVELKESLRYNMISQKIFKVENEEKYWIKRVIGVPGDVIYAKDGVLYRNGEPIEESYVNPDSPPRYNNFAEPVTVAEGYIFVMGDNRNASHDSRMIGQIPINDVLGKVVFGD